MERTGPGDGTGRSDDPLIGRVLDGRYRVGQQVARGGMATVYQAEDLRLERTVAVKVMHAGLADDPEFVARFEREARSAARLSHHNVVAVYDQGDDHGTLFLVMEFVPGITLRDVIRREAPIDPGKALGLIEPVLAALAAAHSAGMIHRDVKPENVLIATDSDTGEGRVKVADFGLARAVNAETQHTATGGVLIGTVSYLSPELVVDGKADARSDVYAAGVLIYEMLTGVKPHQAENPIQVAYKHVHEDVPAPSLRVPGLPAYVDALVARATARDRDLRPADARVLLHQVRRVRQALDHGVVDDPDLVEDLLPNSRRDPGSVPTGVIPIDRSSMQVDDVYDVAHDEDDFGADYTVPVRSAAVPNPPPPPPPVRPPPPRIAHEPGAPARRPRRSRRGLFMLIGVLLLALIVGIAAWELGSGATVPSVANLSLSDARAKVTNAGLTLRVGTPEYSTTVLKDVIIRSSPNAGDSVSQGDTVTVYVSLGPELRAVPSLSGQTLESATALIEGAHLKVGTVTEHFNDTVPAGQVIRTNPATGQQVPLQTLIDVMISKGRQPITIPDWTGKSAKAAQKELEKLGFTVTLQQSYSDTVKSGKVITQTPNTGTGFKKDVITLVVSQGVQMIMIPPVRRQSLQQATAALEALGFVVESQRSNLYVGADLVAGSNPPEGTLAPHGSVVVLVIV